MGYAVGSFCFASADQAAALACSGLAGVTSSGTLQCSGVTGVTGQVADVSMVSWPEGASQGVTFSQAVYMPACEAPSVADGMAVGWAVGTVWLVIAGVMYLRKVLP